MPPVALRKVNLAAKFARIDEPWKPRIVGEINDCQVKLVRFAGEFTWHRHDTEDELFLVVTGRMVMALKDQPDLELAAGEFLVVPRGVEHKPLVPPGEQAEVMLFEPRSTLNTGSVRDEQTVAAEWL